jgi:hypothetical protein
MEVAGGAREQQIEQPSHEGVEVEGRFEECLELQPVERREEQRRGGVLVDAVCEPAGAAPLPKLVRDELSVAPIPLHQYSCAG